MVHGHHNRPGAPGVRDTTTEFPPVHIVGPVDSPRSSTLVAGLNTLGVSWTMTGGPEPGSTAWLRDVVVDQSTAITLERRPLVTGEIAAVLAHRRAVAAATATDQEWTIFLEDDAELLPGFVEACVRAARIRSSTPTVVLLYRDAQTVCRPLPRSGHGTLRATIAPPQGAVGYLLNRASVSGFPISGPITGVADWPYPWSNRQQFLQVRPGVVTTGSQLSLIGYPRQVTWQQTDEPMIRRVARIATTVTGMRYLKYRASYGTWRDYRAREFGRLASALLGHHPGRRR